MFVSATASNPEIARAMQRTASCQPEAAPQDSFAPRTYTEIPQLPYMAMTNIKPQEAATPEGRSEVASELQSHLRAFPSLTAVVGVLPVNGQETRLVVASRDKAVEASPMEGIYEISQRLTSSDFVKTMAARYPSEYHAIKPFDAEGKTNELRLPGNISLETAEMALVEGRSPNRYDQLDGFVDSLPQGKRVAVLLGGPSGAGKTRLIEKLQECAGDRKVKVVEGDMFFWGTDCPGGIPKTKTGEIYWDHERYMDIPRLQNDLSTLLATGKVDLPVYDFNPRPGSGSFIGHRSDETRHVEVGADDIIVVDSVHAVNKSIVDTLETNQLPYRILFLDSPLAEERLIRRIVREYDVRGSLTAETTLNLWDNSTYQGEVEFIRPHLMSMDPARDLTMTLEFPSDVRMSRKEVGERVAAMAKYGLSPGYEAFRVKEDELPELAIREEQRLVDVLATSKDEKALARAQKELDLLRNAPAYRKA